MTLSTFVKQEVESPSAKGNITQSESGQEAHLLRTQTREINAASGTVKEEQPNTSACGPCRCSHRPVRVPMGH